MIEYVDALGPYWMKLIEQMIPATTIWMTGVRLENSIFHKQKFVYRRQRGCQIVPVPAEPCFIVSNIFDYDCNTSFTEFSIYPWLNGNTTVSNFTGILANRVNNFYIENNLSPEICSQNSVNSKWYMILTIGSQTIINEYFYNGFGISDAPTDYLWRTTLINNLYKVYQYGYTYTLNGNKLTITNLRSVSNNTSEEVNLSVGINLSINCFE